MGDIYARRNRHFLRHTLLGTGIDDMSALAVSSNSLLCVDLTVLLDTMTPVVHPLRRKYWEIMVDTLETPYWGIMVGASGRLYASDMGAAPRSRESVQSCLIYINCSFFTLEFPSEDRLSKRAL